MKNLPLQLKYRPKNFENFIGNNSTITALKSSLDKKTVRCYLIHGKSGCGKTTLARIIATKLGATDRDIKELNVSNQRGIDKARKIITLTIYRPLGGVRVFILDEAHRSTVDFQNAMLKIMEEPPKGNYFVLCTTEPEKLLETIKNRCSIFHVRELSIDEITILLNYVIKEEGRESFSSTHIYIPLDRELLVERTRYVGHIFNPYTP